MMPEAPFLRREGRRLLAGDQPVTLKGVNLGGWLMMEGYLLHAPNRPEQLFRQQFAEARGAEALAEFDTAFRDHFIREEDFRRIAGWGFNCVRLPFHHRVVESAPYVYEGAGLKYLDLALMWAQRYGLRVILDLHAAPGSQNHDWHSDSLGPAALWQSKDFQDRTAALWGFLAHRYHDYPALAGYDLVNEPETHDRQTLNAFYRRLVDSIRAQDPRHLIFMEGHNWSTDLEILDEMPDESVVLSAHYYGDLGFTFNLVPHQRHVPSRAAVLSRHAKTAEWHGRPVLIGEFGINGRAGLWGEAAWLEETLTAFASYDFHWTYWTYKAVKNAVFPDGILSSFENPAWVNRQGPKTGWETYADCWPAEKSRMIASWCTDVFQPNGPVLETLQKFL